MYQCNTWNIIEALFSADGIPNNVFLTPIQRCCISLNHCECIRKIWYNLNIHVCFIY